jgi:hypothetical protein
MSNDEGTWFELQPDSALAEDAEHYGDRAAAEQAATAMLIRRPELEFVEIAQCELQDGQIRQLGVVARIAGARPPAPSEAEVDDLHRLPRGDPEC